VPDADLLQPSIQDDAARKPLGRKPWRLGSQVYVAFFGGPAGAGIIGVINAARLRMPPLQQAAIAGAALLALGALAAVGSASSGALQLAVRVAGLAVYGVVYLMQRKPDRIYHYYNGGDAAYSELFAPGLAAVLVGIAVEIALIGALGD
jgi:hypothetical protein